MARLATPATLVCVCVTAAWLAASAVLDVGAALTRVPVPAAVSRATDKAADCNLIAALTRLLLGLMVRPCRYNLSATAG